MPRDLICEVCGGPFLSRRGNANRFCSRQCAGTAHGIVELADQAFHLSILERDILHIDALARFGVVFEDALDQLTHNKAKHGVKS